jgi:hypothetical protein
MEHSDHEQNLLNADKARIGLADDIRDFNHVGKHLLRSGEQKLKHSVLALGATALGGLVVGIALGRACSARRGSSMGSNLLGRATAVFATTLAHQVFGVFVAKRIRAVSD